MWIVSKALHVSPFSDTIKTLSESQFMWILMNYSKDEEEDWKKIELQCRFINPAAASELFDKKTVETTVSTKDTIFTQISKDLGHRYSPEELEAIMNDPKHYSELDVIKKA